VDRNPAQILFIELNLTFCILSLSLSRLVVMIFFLESGRPFVSRDIGVASEIELRIFMTPRGLLPGLLGLARASFSCFFFRLSLFFFAKAEGNNLLQ